MFDTLKQYKNIIFGLVAIVALYFGYMTYGPEENLEEFLTSDTNNLEGTAAGEEAIVILEKVRNIKFRTELFEDPLFINLVDRSVPITPEPKHRRDPFQPFGFGVDEGGSIATPISIAEFVSGSFKKEEEDEEDISDGSANLFLDDESKEILEEGIIGAGLVDDPSEETLVDDEANKDETAEGDVNTDTEDNDTITEEVASEENIDEPDNEIEQ